MTSPTVASRGKVGKTVRNYVQRGDTITLPLPAGADLHSGDPILVGAIFGVCGYRPPTGGQIEVGVVGVYELAKAPGALNAGDLAYFDPNSRLITAVDTGTALVGTVIAAAAHDGPTAHVRLNGISTKVTPTGSGKQ
jgi:predicted RecA/RadA family phage recombinase